MAPHWNDRFGNPHSSNHAVGWRAAESVRASAAKIAELIGGDPDEIVFTSGATEANNLAIIGLARRAPRERRRILVSAIEHKCVLAAACYLAENEGFTVDSIPVDESGYVDLGRLTKMVDDDVLVVSIMAVNNEIGTIQNISEIAGTLDGTGALFHCDAAQAPCAMDISGLASAADLISLSGHKMYGPLGIGALFVRRELKGRLGPIIHGGGQQGGLRSGTVPMPLCVGMAKAAEILTQSDADHERGRIARQRDLFVNQLRENNIPITVNGSEGDRRHPGNINLQFAGFDAHDLLSALQPDLAASTGSACTSGITEPSHVLRAIGLTSGEAESSIRFSFGRFTNDRDIEIAVSRLSSLSRLNFLFE